jgi:hypothetical protein
VGVGCFAKARRVVLLPQDLYRYTVRPASMSNAGDAAHDFAFQVLCHVTCLKVYAKAGDAVHGAIDTLYTRQFRYDRYRVKDLRALDAHAGRLRQCLAELAVIRPTAIHALIHTFDKQGEPEPRLPLRYWLGQLRRSMARSATALVKGRS